MVFFRVVVAVTASQIALAIYRAIQGVRPERFEWLVLAVLVVVGVASFGAIRRLRRNPGWTFDPDDITVVATEAGSDYGFFWAVLDELEPEERDEARSWLDTCEQPGAPDASLNYGDFSLHFARQSGAVTIDLDDTTASEFPIADVRTMLDT